uniref:Uncharacterized protein n=1 Tax=Anguilla anguilla TaxID=7936 RepID=A0A0E9WDU0_ANGAN
MESRTAGRHGGSPQGGPVLCWCKNWSCSRKGEQRLERLKQIILLELQQPKQP